MNSGSCSQISSSCNCPIMKSNGNILFYMLIWRNACYLELTNEVSSFLNTYIHVCNFLCFKKEESPKKKGSIKLYISTSYLGGS